MNKWNSDPKSQNYGDGFKNTSFMMFTMRDVCAEISG